MSCLGGVCNTDTKRRFFKTPKPSNILSINAKREKGLFLSASILMGSTPNKQFDLTKVVVVLNIDGKLVVQNMSLANMNWFGYDKQNNSCIKVTEPSSWRYGVTIGYPYPLQFKKSCTLQVLVSDKKVKNLTLEMTYGFPQ